MKSGEEGGGSKIDGQTSKSHMEMEYPTYTMVILHQVSGHYMRPGREDWEETGVRTWA